MHKRSGKTSYPTHTVSKLGIGQDAQDQMSLGNFKLNDNEVPQSTW
jgi:hypothetical protein